MPGASATGYSAPARRTMASAAAGEASLMSIPRKWIVVCSLLATEANVPSSAWQATQVDWNQFTTAGPLPSTAEVTLAPLPRRERSKFGTLAGDA